MPFFVVFFAVFFVVFLAAFFFAMVQYLLSYPRNLRVDKNYVNDFVRRKMKSERRILKR